MRPGLTLVMCHGIMCHIAVIKNSLYAINIMNFLGRGSLILKLHELTSQMLKYVKLLYKQIPMLLN